MNKEERAIMDLLTEAHNKYISLPVTHNADYIEWTFFIHGLQRTITQRVIRRDYPDDFPNKF